VTVVIALAMSAPVKSCYLRSLEETPTNLYLPDNTPIFVGRSPETGITDAKCSRQQGCISSAKHPFFHVAVYRRDKSLLAHNT